MNIPTERSVDAPVLLLEALGKSFRGKPALRDVSFSVPASSLTVILGPAGAGKTTTLRLIAGLDRPDGGRVVLSGQDVSGWEPRDRDIAMIFDNLALYPNKTGFENIASPLRIQGLPKDVIEERVTAMAVKLRLSNTLDRLPGTMSGGERQRVALGRALVRTPRLFLLDEPLSSLDAMLRIELRAELKRLQRECGCTFLMATPDYTEALAIADTVVLLRLGRAVQIDTPQNIYDHPVDREAAIFVGAPLINLVPARFETPDGSQVQVVGGVLPAPDHLRQVRVAGTEAFEMGIRPENLALVEDPDAAPIQAEVSDIEPLGLKSVLTVRNQAGELRLCVESARAADLALGHRVGVAVLDGSRLLAFDAATGLRLAG